MKKLWGPASIFFFFFSVYLATAAPSIYWWDSGELVANVKTLGIPHRPGFPLYVILAKVFSLLPIANFVYELNLFSAFCGALALLFFHLSMVLFLGRQGELLSGSPARRHLTAFLVTLAVGFTFTFWIQAVRAEVYTLGALLFAFAFYCFLRATPHPQSLSAGGGESDAPPAVVGVENYETARWFWLGIFTSFLGLGNHHITLLSTFPFLIAVIGLTTFTELKFTRWLGLIFLFVLGASIYAYLPIRSSAHPIFNWGGAFDFNSTANLVLATDSYQTISWSFFDVTVKMFRILSLFFDQLGPGLFGLSFLGLLILLFVNKSWFYKIALLIVGNLLVCALLAQEVFPDNPDLHGYAVYALFGLGLGLAVSIGAVFGIVERAVGAVSNFLIGFARILLALMFLVACMAPWGYSRWQCDLSENRVALRMAQEALSPVPPGGVVFLDSPNLDFVLRGVQFGERWRQDVAIVNRAFLGADWYRASLLQNFPRLKKVFASGLKKPVPDLLFHKWANQLLAKKVPVFVEFTERDKNIVNRLSPAGFLYQLNDSIATLDTVALEKQLVWEMSNIWSEDDRVMRTDPQAVKMLVLYLYRSGLYYEWRGVKKRALYFYKKTMAWGEQGEELSKRIFQLEKEMELAKRNVLPALSADKSKGKPLAGR